MQANRAASQHSYLANMNTLQIHMIGRKNHTFLIVRAKIAFGGSKWRQSLAPRHFILKRIKSGKCHLL
jgi:hypothetical protein